KRRLWRIRCGTRHRLIDQRLPEAKSIAVGPRNRRNQVPEKTIIAQGTLYVNDEEGLSVDVIGGMVHRLDYGARAEDERLRWPGYTGIFFSSDVPKELRGSLLERLCQRSFRIDPFLII